MVNQPLKFINHCIEEYALDASYDPGTDTGSVIYNLSFIRDEDFEDVLPIIRKVFGSGLSVSDHILFAGSGEMVGAVRVPDGCAGVCTVCSITLDAVLLRHGVPLNPIGGGMLEMEDGVPLRFTNIILYRDTTIDPLEMLISQGTTSVLDVTEHGSGKILANIREYHMEAEAMAGELLDEFTACGFTGILDVGAPNVPLLGVAVRPQYLGAVMTGGTNAMAAIRESGYRVATEALKGVMDIKEMNHIRDY